MFQTTPGEVLLIADVQAHNLTGAPPGAPNQPKGGQLFLMSNTGGTVPTLFSRFDATPENFSAKLRWDVQDNAALESFRLLRNGVVTTTLRRDTRSYLDESLAPGAVYDYVLVAVDNTGDETQSAPVRVTIPKAEVELPSQSPQPVQPRRRFASWFRKEWR